MAQMDRTAIVLLLTLALFWGGSFFFVEIALTELGPFTIVLFRVAMALPLLAIFVWLRGIPVPRTLPVWLGYAGMGLLNNAIPFSLIFWGQVQIESGLASILNATTAMFGAVVAGLLLRDEPLSANRVVGALLGLLGVIVIMGPDALAGFDLANLGQLAILGASLSYACASVWGKVRLVGQHPMMNALGMVTCGTLWMLPVVFWVEGLPSLTYSMPVWSALFGLSIGSTVLAYTLYFAILARAGAANLMLVTLLIPVIAIFLGAAFLGETLSGAVWMGFAVITFGFLVTDGRLFRWTT